MVDINAKIVQQLRQKTGVGMMDCKKRRKAPVGDFEQRIYCLERNYFVFLVEMKEIR